MPARKITRDPRGRERLGLAFCSRGPADVRKRYELAALQRAFSEMKAPSGDPVGVGAGDLCEETATFRGRWAPVFLVMASPSPPEPAKENLGAEQAFNLGPQL